MHFAVLGFADTAFFFFFYRLKVYSNPISRKLISGIFISICLFHLYHILVTLTIFQTIYICYGDLWSVIFDVFIIIVLGFLGPCSCKTQRLMNESMNVVCVLTAPLISSAPITLLFFGSPCSLGKRKTEIKPINDPRRPTVQLKGKIIHLLHYIKS